MYNHLLSQPVKYEVDQHQTLHLSLPDEVSDFAILPALSQPIAEVIVKELKFNNANVLQGATIILTCQPLFKVSVQEQINTIVDNDHNLISQLKRGVGQGFRLYTRSGVAPKKSATMLRQGTTLVFSFAEGLQIKVKGQLGDAIKLEDDFRLNQEPKALMHARAILARSFNYEDAPATIAINMSEIEQVRAEITAYLSSEHNKVNAVIAAQLIKLDNLLSHKHRWLLRTYSQSQQRTNFATAANELSKNVEDLQRKLECFSLLAPADVSQMVDKLTEEHE